MIKPKGGQEINLSEKGTGKVAPVIKAGGTRKKLDLLVKAKVQPKVKSEDEEEEEKMGNQEDRQQKEGGMDVSWERFQKLM